MKARTTAERIHEHYAKKPSRQSNRLGISKLGEECERKLWYDFRWVAPPEKFDGRMNRLFDTGHREEDRVVEDLRAIGCGVAARDPETGEQFEFVAEHGHVVGKLDGIVENTVEAPDRRVVLEVKTHNQKSFDKLREKGVEKAKPVHFGQCQLGAHLSGLDATLYVAVNKDTDDIHSELVPLNRKKSQALLDKGERVVFAKEPPAKLKDSAEYPPCSWCLHRDLCHYSTAHKPVIPVVSCRTCKFAEVHRDGKWGCSKRETFRSKEEQEAGCPDHLFNWHLLPFDEPIEEGDGWQLFAGMMVNTAGGRVFHDDGTD